MFTCKSPGCDNWAKPPRAYSPPLGLGNWENGGAGGVNAASAPHLLGRHPPARAPRRRVLTALVSYRTSFWTELIMGAAAAGMARASGGPQGRAPGRGPGCGSLCPPPQETRREDVSDPALQLQTRKTPPGRQIYRRPANTLKCFRILRSTSRQAQPQARRGRGWRVHHREVV